MPNSFHSTKLLTVYTKDRTRSSSANRRRAQSNAVRPVSPCPPSDRGHMRANSEYTGGLFKNQRHSRHDSSLAAHTSSDRLKAHPETPQEDMHGSFLFEESTSEASLESARSSADAMPQLVSTQSHMSLTEDGATFDELVDRLSGPADLQE